MEKFVVKAAIVSLTVALYGIQLVGCSDNSREQKYRGEVQGEKATPVSKLTKSSFLSLLVGFSCQQYRTQQFT